MPKSITEQLDETFHAASVGYMRNVLKSDRDQVELQGITQRSEEKRAEIHIRFHEEYDARVDTARKELFDKATRLNLNHPAPPGGGNDRASAIDREARRLVAAAHEADLERTRQTAQQEIEDLLDRAQKRNQVRGLAGEAFRRASDRRSGEERRVQRHSQD